VFPKHYSTHFIKSIAEHANQARQQVEMRIRRVFTDYNTSFTFSLKGEAAH
jgi:hypothetical protein